MENIPLRTYNREIEQLIDSDHSQDALKHCQHILDIYPRCLETFRLLGKAYLELNQFELAEETFQKVLSSIPDDFTANLGMSLLREKQNDLNGTIWHMERAYEAQPSNTAVQTELRRLNQQRDGVQTSRLRLTRGALVRMYIRGDLYPQALSEIQAILLEDPSRIDIRILQSVALLYSGKTDDALQNCRQILQELPYCYEANKLLYENSPSSTRIEEVQKYQQHLRELDPYYEFTNKINPDPLKVADDEVKINIPDELRLQKSGAVSDVLPPSSAFESLSTPSHSETAGKSGVDNKNYEFSQSNPQKEEKPAWLDGIEIASFNEETKAAQSELSSESSYTPRKEFELSEPMTTEGSTPKNEFPKGKEEDSDQPFEDSLPKNPFLTSTGGQIPVAEPGDIPEWLRALASEPPAASSDAITAPLRVPGETGVLQTGEENLDFLRNLPGESRSQTGELTELPERKLNLAAETPPGIIPSDPFLVTSETTQPIPIEVTKVEKITPVLDVPEWLKNAEEKPVETPSKVEFKQEFTPEAQQTQENAPSFSVDDFQLSGEQQNQAQPVSPAAEEVPTPEIEQYLEQLRKDISPGEQPEWLQKENLGSDIEALFNEDNKPAVQPSSLDQAPSWMADLKKEDLEPPQVPQNNPPMSVPNVPDWLFTPETGDEDTAPIEFEAPVTKQPSPDWLKDVKPEVLGLTENQEPFNINQSTTGETADQE
jgi:tetratricopeptide (TPR) repeat protein